jgi:hypothetical protein
MIDQEQQRDHAEEAYHSPCPDCGGPQYDGEHADDCPRLTPAGGLTMAPVLYAVRITGHGADALTIHARHEDAVAAFRRQATALYVDRFGYAPEFTDAVDARDRLLAEGWAGRIEPVTVEL